MLKRSFALMPTAVLSLFLVCLSFSLSYAGDIAIERPSLQKNMQLLSTFEGGKLYSAGKFPVLEFSGTYRQMGRQYGLLIGTNHFISPGWSLPASEYLEAIKDSKERYDNLKKLAEKNKGKIDASIIMDMMDVPQDKGGATPQDKNIYQFVALPEDLKIWVKALTYSDWTEVDLKLLLHR